MQRRASPLFSPFGQERKHVLTVSRECYIIYTESITVRTAAKTHAARIFKEDFMLPDPIFWKVHMYGVMVAVGILAAVLMLFYGCKKKGIEEKFVDFLFYNSIGSIVLGFGSAALFQAIYDYIKTGIFDLTAGLTFIGGLIGGAVTFLASYFIFRKRYTSKLLDVLSILPVCIATVRRPTASSALSFRVCQARSTPHSSTRQLSFSCFSR